MQKAKALGRARMLGDPEEIKKAKLDHDTYRDLCLKADQMSLGVHYSDLL